MRVLVVDDNAHAREILGVYLEQFSFQVSTATSGEEALARLREAADEPFGLVLMDYLLPGMDGVQTLKRLTAQQPAEKLPKRILISARNPVEIDLEGAGATVDAVLAKPVNPSMLFDVVMETFGMRAGGHCSRRLHGNEDENAALAAVKGARVLLVEDNRINQQVAREYLSQAGFQVEVANHGREALEKVRNERPFDCLLMDVQMPIMDGFTATRKLRQDPHYMDLPIIALTANASNEDREKALAAGMNGHVSKPINPQRLLAEMLRWIKPGERNVLEEKVSPPPTRDEAPEAGEMAGFDLELGLDHCAQNPALYRQLLQSFRDSHADDLRRIDAALADGDQETALRTAHTLKSVGITLGAVGMSEAARLLEDALAHPNGQHRETLLEALRNEFDTVLESLDQLLQTEPPSADEQPGHSAHHKIDHLHAKLRAMDPDALTAGQDLIGHLHGQVDRGTLESLGEQVERFEFDQALATLEQVRREFSDRLQ